jgi:hypothetical protein
MDSIFGLRRTGAFELDSAVPADARSEEQTFRSEPSLSLRLIRLRRKWVFASERTIDHRWFKMKCKTYNGEVRSSEKDFETLQLGAFATPGLLLAQRLCRNLVKSP